MSDEDKKLQKHLVDEMMEVYETNPNVMIYMQSLMENYEKLEQENKQLKQRNKEIYDGFMVAIDEVCETDREKREYKSRIDKANEILSKSCFEYDNCPDSVINEIIELKEILGDKE